MASDAMRPTTRFSTATLSYFTLRESRKGSVRAPFNGCCFRERLHRYAAKLSSRSAAA
jgi:hypothetical protein